MYIHVAFPCFSCLKKTKRYTHIQKCTFYPLVSSNMTNLGKFDLSTSFKVLLSALIFCHFWRILRFPLVWNPPICCFVSATVFPGSLRWAAEITTLQGMWTTCAWWRLGMTGDWNSSGDVGTKPWETMIRYGGFTGCTPKWTVYKGKTYIKIKMDDLGVPPHLWKPQYGKSSN